MEKIHKQKEFKSLNNALLQDEVIHDYVVANIKNARFLVVATDKRVIFVQKKLMSESIEAINLDDIALSPFKSGFLGTSFGINHHILKIQDKKKAQSFYNLLSPHSGQSNVVTTQHKKKNNTVGLIAFIIISVSGLVVLIDNYDENHQDVTYTQQNVIKPKYDLSLAKNYNVINKRNTGFANYHRGQVHIYANTTSEAERIATLIQAAKDLKSSEDYQYFQVFLHPYPKEMSIIGTVGSLTYDVYGKGVSSRDTNSPSMNISVALGNITPEQDKVIKAWDKYRDNFIQDGIVNEEKLKAYLIKNKILTPQELDLLPVFFDTKKVTIFE
ncbi:hypothetical protein B9T10_02225 [Wohlfahrtiimonas chitiniclastica]|uniref:DUF4875 domain-containing protein n=1 Tax=Wohlfahrtiimonas chitiniclastica TaxID=400946 RepID=UPI000B999A51|nr:PH domain-containing protein [Wohlfahrtiimonas chitiniclastica]OYQ90158.1 hypothetical protein B9T10_02225 [Wohlfahrtiimonas chitiniclastica]